MTRAVQIKDFPNYFVTDNGDIYSRFFKNGRIKKLKQRKQNSGYFLVHIWSKSKRHAKTVHRLVAEAFIPNPHEKAQVNHKNGIKTDNYVENLEWATESENTKHSFDILGQKATWEGKFGKDHPCSKYVSQLKNGEVIADYFGILDAHRQTGIHAGDISLCCLGKRKSAGGFQWKYKRKEESDASS